MIQYGVLGEQAVVPARVLAESRDKLPVTQGRCKLDAVPDCLWSPAVF
jgi:hypothetical protein